MNPELLSIFDNALRVSLWVFMGAFLLMLLVSRRRLVRHAVRTADSNRARKFNPAYDQARVAFRSMAAAALLGIVLLAVYLFGPIPGINNLVNGASWQLTPLRVTAVSWDRVYEGFELEGEVWNQTREDMEGVSAVISVVGSYDELLDSLVVPVEPIPLESGESGSFSVSYLENSPFIKGYRLGFTDGEGKPIRHTAGFDQPY